MALEQSDGVRDPEFDHDPLIHSVYSGPLEDSPWQTFLERFKAALGASSVTLLLRAPEEADRGVLLSSGTNRHWEDAYRDRFFSYDPFGSLDRGVVRSLDEVLSKDEMLAHPFYSELLKPGGSSHVLALDVRAPMGLLAKLRMTRTQQQGRFGDPERALCVRISTHLELALQLHSRIAGALTERDLYARAVDRFSIGAVILDEHAQVIHMNRIASQILEQGDGLTISKGELNAPTAKEKMQLQQLIHEVACAHQAGNPSLSRAIRIDCPSGRGSIGVLLRPVPLPPVSNGQRFPAVAVFISDTSLRSHTQAHVLQSLFDLTRAEAHVAELLREGLTVDEMGTELGISKHTVRAHLRTIFSKTGVTRQADLLSLLLRSVAALG